MKDRRQEYAEHLLIIKSPEILDRVFSLSFDLLKIELDRHNKIVEKGRNYLSVDLILLGIVLTLGNFIFTNTSLKEILPSFLISLIGGAFASSIFAITISLFYNLYVSFIHSYLWFDFEDLTSIPENSENLDYLYKTGQIAGFWDKIDNLVDNNEKLVTKLKIASILSVWSIIMLSLIVLLAMYTKLYIFIF